MSATSWSLRRPSPATARINPEGVYGSLDGSLGGCSPGTESRDPAGVLIGFGTEDDGFDDRLQHDPAFRRIEWDRVSLRRDEGVRLEDIGDGSGGRKGR
jgi:hypothetical protein